MPPGSEDVPFGSDYLGRDILAGIIHGGRPTLLVGMSAALIAALIGISIGRAVRILRRPRRWRAVAA